MNPTVFEPSLQISKSVALTTMPRAIAAIAGYNYKYMRTTSKYNMLELPTTIV